MDRTLRPAARRNRRRSARNAGAWARFALDGRRCPYCRHAGADHRCTSGQPHFYRPATAAERRNPHLTLYRHLRADGSHVLVRRMTVARDAEIVTAYCTACARELRTHQALCFVRTRAVGEVVGDAPGPGAR